MYRFNWRTAKPLEPLSAPGCDKPTSRCQITPSIGTLKSGKPVIPSVPFIFCAMPLTSGTPGHYDRLSSQYDCKVYLSSKHLPLRSHNCLYRNESTFVNPRCSLEGDRPSQTNQPTFLEWTNVAARCQEWEAELPQTGEREDSR